MCLCLLRRLVLGRRLQCCGAQLPIPYPTDLPTALAAMPALRELELHGVDCLSSAPEQELPAAPQPAFSNLTSLSMSYETDSGSAATALYLWLCWALPTAPQLRKLSVSSAGNPSNGIFPSIMCGCKPTFGRTASLRPNLHLPVLPHISMSQCMHIMTTCRC